MSVVSVVTADVNNTDVRGCSSGIEVSSVEAASLLANDEPDTLLRYGKLIPAARFSLKLKDDTAGR